MNSTPREVSTTPIARLFAAMVAPILIGIAGCGEQQAADQGDGSADSTVEWYVPSEDEFREIYARDVNNQARQDWDDYWGWVKKFYEGNLFFDGWTKQSAKLIEAVSDATAQNKLRARLNELGRSIVAEWAKDNSLRKIDTNDLRAFAKRLFDAKKKDDGLGAAIHAEIEAVRQAIHKHLS